MRCIRGKLTGLRGALAALGLIGAAQASPCYAQAPNLGTAADYGVLAGSTVTNTGPSVIQGNVGVAPGAAVVGFPPGIVTPPGVIHAADAVAGQAQTDLTTGYLSLAGRPVTADLSGQNLGGLTLTPGYYNFSSSAQLTGALTLNAQGNPNAVFIFNIGSALTTGSNASVMVIGGGQGTNVFWRIGSSATLGSDTAFVGDILALTSITLVTGATISCGSALARNGAVTLDTNRISIGNLAPCTTTLVPPVTPGAPPGVTTAINAGFTNAVGAGAPVPEGLVVLASLSPEQQANALRQLSGEAGSGASHAGILAMNSFLSLVNNPFADNRDFAPESQPAAPRHLAFYKGPVPIEAAPPPPPRWGIWGAAYGAQNNTAGDASSGTHDRSARAFGFATGLDYRVTPATMVGFALGGGGTNYGLSDSLGGGRSDMAQAAVYSLTRFNSAYVAATLAYAWHGVSTDRFLSAADGEHLNADFSANNIGGRVEGGYRFAIPTVYSLWGLGVTPYAALQAQGFRTPAYHETSTSGPATFALAYAAHTTTTTRTELGVWLDWPIAFDNGAVLALRTRTAWAHDHWSDPDLSASFESLSGSSFSVVGAAPAHNSLLSSASAELSFKNGISVAGTFDGEFTNGSQTYRGTAQLRYTW